MPREQTAPCLASCPQSRRWRFHLSLRPRDALGRRARAAWLSASHPALGAPGRAGGRLSCCVPLQAVRALPRFCGRSTPAGACWARSCPRSSSWTPPACSWWSATSVSPARCKVLTPRGQPFVSPGAGVALAVRPRSRSPGPPWLQWRPARSSGECPALSSASPAAVVVRGSLKQPLGEGAPGPGAEGSLVREVLTLRPWRALNERTSWPCARPGHRCASARQGFGPWFVAWTQGRSAPLRASGASEVRPEETVVAPVLAPQAGSSNGGTWLLSGLEPGRPGPGAIRAGPW